MCTFFVVCPHFHTERDSLHCNWFWIEGMGRMHVGELGAGWVNPNHTLH